MNKSKIKSFLSFTLILSVSIYSLFTSDGQIEQLRSHSQNCEFQKTIELAEVILKNQKTNKKERKEAFILKGIAEYSSNRYLDSRITFIELLLFDKNITLDSVEISPKIIEFFNELKNHIKHY